MSDTYERPRRRPAKKPNYKPLIAAMSAVLVVLSIVAIAVSVPGCGPQGAKKPATQNTTSITTLSRPTNVPTTLTTAPTLPPVTTLPTEPPVVRTGTATIAAMGDMLMHMPCVRPAQQADGSYDFGAYFTHLQDYIISADYAVANLETTLAGANNGYKYSGYPNFNCPDGIVTSLKNAGFDMLLTANNHTYDTNSVGFFRTQQVIMENGLAHIGTKPDAESDSYKIVEINGIRIGMINYTYETNSDPNKVDLNGGADLKENEKNLINVFLKDDVAGFKADLAEKLADMRADGAEAVVLYIHWGEEYQTRHNVQQSAMAQAACDLGVDVIVGGHPHVIQPMELLESENDPNHKTVCLYSTGNALSNQRIKEMNLKSGHTEDGIVFTFSFAKYSDGTVRVENVELLPTWVNLYTSQETQKAVYDILPLDQQIEDWKTQFGLTDSTLTQAEKSYERTMKIVGPGLQIVNDYLATLPPVM